jgi:hypothetical protein
VLRVWEWPRLLWRLVWAVRPSAASARFWRPGEVVVSPGSARLAAVALASWSRAVLTPLAVPSAEQQGGCSAKHLTHR